MINHHPGDDLLLQRAAGRLDAGQARVLAVHLESCATCRGRLRLLEAVGGALLDDAEPQALAADAWTRTLARIDSQPPVPPRTSRPHGIDVSRGSVSSPAPAGATPAVPAHRARAAAPLALPAGMDWPQSLQGCTSDGWRWMGPGMRYARLVAPEAPHAKLFLLRIGQGRSLAQHTHTGLELTQVLRGSFEDGRAVFAEGDFDTADDDVHHQPIVARDGECICLAYVGRSLKFNGRVASWIGGLIGM